MKVTDCTEYFRIKAYIGLLTHLLLIGRIPLQDKNVNEQGTFLNSV